VLAAMTMSNEEFDQLVAQRNQLTSTATAGDNASRVVQLHNSLSLLTSYSTELTLTATAGDNASTDTSGDGGGVVGGEDGL